MLIPLLALANAGAAPFHTCEAHLEAVGLDAMTITGFGATEGDALRSARKAARVLADQRLLVEATRAWLAGHEPSRDTLAMWVQTAGTEQLATPGWKLTPGPCTESEVESPEGFGAKWPAGSEFIVRSYPADALEAARRRACVTPFQVAFMQALQRHDTAETDLATLDGAWTQLRQCWTQPAPVVTAATPLGPDTVGASRCAVIDEDGAVAALGYGSSAERAAEDALQQALYVKARSIVGNMGRALTSGDPAEAPEHLRAELARVATLTGANDRIDRARLACSSVVPGAMAWKAEGKLERECNSASWTERPREPVTADLAGSFLDTTCTLQVDPTMAIVRFSLGATEGARRDGYVAGAYRVAGTCESACYSQTTWGTEAKPVTLAGMPDRSEKKTVVAAIRSAAKGEAGMLRGLELLPTLQTPDGLGRLLSGGLLPELAEQHRTLAGLAEHWTQIEGHWVLLP